MTGESTTWVEVLVVVSLLLVAPIWLFSLLNIFRRRDLTDCWKTWWSAVVLLVPILGTLAYVVYLNVRPTHVTSEEGHRRLEYLSDLHDRGTLTDEEFAAERERVTASVGSRAHE